MDSTPEDVVLPGDDGPAIDSALCDPQLSSWPLKHSHVSEGEYVWVPFSFTHVEYVKGDIFGMMLAISSLLPIFVVVGFATLIYFRRDLHTIAFFAGTLLNELINMVLKRSLGHLRPCTNRKHYGSNYAMPSNHAQFAWFFITYLILFVLFRLRQSPVPPKSRLMEMGWKVLVVCGSMLAGCAVSFSRAYLHYHSGSQVLLGSCVGIFLGIAWYLMVGSYLIPLFPVIASWRMSEALLIRDTTLIPNIFLFEYSKIREENSLRLRKLRSSNRNQ